MSEGDKIQLAVLSVQQWVTAPAPPHLDAAKATSVTFYKVLGKPEILQYTSEKQSGGYSDIKPGTWLQASSFYFWNTTGGQSLIRWGTARDDLSQNLVTLVDAGTTIPAAVQSATTTPAPPLVSSIVAASSTASIEVTSSSNGSVPSSTTSAQLPKPAEQPSKGVSSDAVAGAAIGCLIAGALIAGLIFWFCWGKRKASRVRDYEASNTALMPHEKGFATNAIPFDGRGSAALPVAGTSPLPLEDKAITGEISKISNSIKNHVQSYYQISRVSPGLIDMDDIHAIGSNQPISASTLSTLLDNPTTREIALRFCIAWVVCSRMQPDSDSRTSLLPVEVAGCFQMMAQGHHGSPRHTSSKLAGWRVTTAELIQGSYVRDPFTASDSRNGSIQAALSTLENILRPFADSRMDNGERKRNLEEILKRSALFAFTLFSQPSTWDFDWREAHGVKSGELCIFPALVQLTNESGLPVNPPRPFSEAVVRRLNE